MRTSATILRIVAMLWWCGIGLVLVPHFASQSGLCGAPQRPRDVSEKAFNSPHYEACNLAGAVALAALAGLSILPGRLLRRNRLVFWVTVAATTAPFLFFLFRILGAFVEGGMGPDADIVTTLFALGAIVVWCIATLSLPVSLVLAAVVERRRT